MQMGSSRRKDHHGGLQADARFYRAHASRTTSAFDGFCCHPKGMFMLWSLKTEKYAYIL